MVFSSFPSFLRGRFSLFRGVAHCDMNDSSRGLQVSISIQDRADPSTL
jgi:hypothetical protein